MSFCYVLWHTEFYKGHLCGHGFGAVHWSLAGLYVGIQLKKIVSPSPESISSEGRCRDIVIPFLVHDLLLIARSCAGLFWAAKAAVRLCDLALVMSCLGDGSAQPFSLSSLFNILSVLFSMMFPELCRAWYKCSFKADHSNVTYSQDLKKPFVSSFTAFTEKRNFSE